MLLYTNVVFSLYSESIVGLVYSLHFITFRLFFKLSNTCRVHLETLTHIFSHFKLRQRFVFNLCFKRPELKWLFYLCFYFLISIIKVCLRLSIFLICPRLSLSVGTSLVTLSVVCKPPFPTVMVQMRKITSIYSNFLEILKRLEDTKKKAKKDCRSTEGDNLPFDKELNVILRDPGESRDNTLVRIDYCCLANDKCRDSTNTC